MKANIRTELPKTFSGKFGEFGQKSVAPPKICLLLHLRNRTQAARDQWWMHEGSVKVLWSLLKPKEPHLGTTVNLLHGSDSWLVPRTMFTSRCLFDLPKASAMLANSDEGCRLEVCG